MECHVTDSVTLEAAIIAAEVLLTIVDELWLSACALLVNRQIKLIYKYETMWYLSLRKRKLGLVVE